MDIKDAVAEYRPEITPQTREDSVPPGYKRTEVGVIPEDWAVVQLEENFDIASSKRVLQSQWQTTGVPFYRTREIADLSEIGAVDNELFISKELYKNYAATYGVPQVGDILVTGIGTIGLAYVVQDTEPFYFKDASVIWLKNRGSFDAEFLGQLFRTRIIKDQIANSSTGTTVATYTISGAKKTAVPAPSLAEQHTIAEALSDADALIAALQRLIDKKRAIKQGTMQALLTGRQRLPGFTGEWETKALGDVAEIIMGQSPNSSNYNRQRVGLPLIQGNADIVKRKTIKRIFTTQVTKRGKAGDVLMSVRAPVGEVARTTFDVCLGRGVCAIRFSNDFLYQLLISMEPSWKRYSKGSTFDSVNSTDVKAIEIFLPIDVVEQTAIATVLSDMDAEIEALETRLAKTREVKAGMMQQLLTGRIRLVEPEGSESAPC